MANGDEYEKERINRDDPCACLTGITSGYRSFYNRLQDIMPDLKGSRRPKAVQYSRKIQKMLVAQYSCKAQ